MKSALSLGAKVALAYLCFIILPSVVLSAAVYHSVRYRDEKPWQRRTPSRFFYPDTGLDYSAGSSIRRESVYREPAPVQKEPTKRYHAKPIKNTDGNYAKTKDFFRIKKRLEPVISNDISGSSAFDNDFRSGAKYNSQNYPIYSSANFQHIDPNTKSLYAGGLIYLMDFRPGTPVY